MKDAIDYISLMDEAMRYIVRRALEQVEENGSFPGGHHFFISFLTGHKGVVISDSLRHKYPHEITIVLQYQFEDLEVKEKEFQVTLSFGGKKERVVVPFEAITAFADPSVRFGLQFKYDEFSAEIEEEELTPEQEAPVKDIKGPAGDNVIELSSFRKKNKKPN
jgi:hypothetical protein